MIELCIFAAFRNRHPRLPLLLVIVPFGIFDCRVEANVLVEVVFLSNTNEVGEDLFLTLRNEALLDYLTFVVSS